MTTQQTATTESAIAAAHGNNPNARLTLVETLAILAEREMTAEAAKLAGDETLAKLTICQLENLCRQVEARR